MRYLDDFLLGATVHFLWNTNAASGASVTRGTNGTVSVYLNNGTTQITTGVTDTEDFDGLTGVHACTIVTTDAAYLPQTNYSVTVNGAAIDGETVNAEIASFSIQNRYAPGLIARGVLQSATATTAVLASGTSFANDLVNGATLVIVHGTGKGQSRLITDWVSASDTASNDTWTTTPDNTSYYEVYATPPASATNPVQVALVDDAITADKFDQSTAFPMVDANGTALTEAGGTGDHLTAINLPDQTMNITGDITGNLSGSVGSVTGAVGSVTGAVGSVTGAVGSVTGNVGGNVAGSVASVTAGVTLANDAITAAKFDESTAFPLAAADSGSTQVARVGADGDTLETLSDEIAAVSTTIGAAGAGLTEAGGTGDHLTALATAANLSTLQTSVNDVPTNSELSTALAAADDAVLAAIAALNNLSAAQAETAAEAAISDMFGIITSSVNDAAATVNGFTVADSAGSEIRLGTLRLTSGALAQESRLVTWTGTTVAVVKPTSVPAGLTTIGPFSAAPANSVTFTFRPL